MNGGCYTVVSIVCGTACGQIAFVVIPLCHAVLRAGGILVVFVFKWDMFILRLSLQEEGRQGGRKAGWKEGREEGRKERRNGRKGRKEGMTEGRRKGRQLQNFAQIRNAETVAVSKGRFLWEIA